MTHFEMAETLREYARPRPAVVRIVHRATDRVCLEYDISHLRPNELSVWVKSVEHYWDNLVFRFEFPDHYEESDV